MDEADRASARETQQREDALKRRYPTLPDTGCCHWCGEITGGGRRFCDVDCRDDWQRARSARQTAGKA